MKHGPHNKGLRLDRLLQTISNEQPIGFNTLLAKRIVSRRLLADYLDELEEESGLIRKDDKGKYVLTSVGLTRLAIPDLYNLDLKLEAASHHFEPKPNYHYVGRGNIMDDYPSPVKIDIIRSLSKEERADLKYYTNFLQYKDFLPAKTAYDESAKGFAYFAREYINNVFHQRIITLANQSQARIKPFTLENLFNEPFVLILSYKVALGDTEKEKLNHGIVGFYLLSLLNIHTADDTVVIKEMTKNGILEKDEGKRVLKWLGIKYRKVDKRGKIKAISEEVREIYKNELYKLALHHLSLANLIDNKLKLFLVIPELICLCQRTSNPKGFINFDLPEVMSIISGIQDRHIMNDDWMQSTTDSMFYNDIVRKCKETYGMEQNKIEQQCRILEYWGIICREETQFPSGIKIKFKLDIASGYPLVASGIELIDYTDGLITAFEKHKKLTLQQARKIVESYPIAPTIVKA